MPGVETRRIPAERDALRLGPTNRIGDPEVLTHVVENELLTPRAPHRVREGVDVVNRALQVLWMVPRLVHQFDEDDRGLVLEREVRVRIYVVEDLAEVIHLRREGSRVRSHAGLAEVSPKSWCCRIAERVRPVGAVQLDWAEQHVDASRLRLRDQVVQE